MNPGTRASAADLLPPSTVRTDRTHAVVADYLSYTGSLTTPPCTAGVRWFVVPSAARVYPASVQRLHALVADFPGYGDYPDNNRPVQPLAARTVERRAG